MAENTTRRMCFNINGLMGGVIATLLLLAILAFLTVQAIEVQKANATNFYEIENPTAIKAQSADNAALRVNK
ncbi:MAG: DUF4006 family protein [Epsilonproteobacteria bacterium]|nr:DUF4006 family protein [Campylobacterota bacterium]